MPGHLMKMRSSIKFQTWLGNNTQRSQNICHKSKIFDSIVSDFGYHEMFLSICHFFVWCSWQLTLCTVSIGFIVLRALSTKSSSLSRHNEVWFVLWTVFLLRSNLESTYELCLSIMPVWLSTQSWNHAFKDFFHIFLPLQLPIEFFYNVYSKKGDNKVELSYP